MESIFEKIFFGAIGGVVAYWVAHRRFISQRWWDKRFDIYTEAIDILKVLEHSLSIYLWALDNKQSIDDSETVKEAYLEFEGGLSKLHGLQSKMMLIGLTQAQTKLTVLYAVMQVVHPSYLTTSHNEDVQDIIRLVKQSKATVAGCSGELALMGRKDLGIGFHPINTIRKYFRESRKNGNL